MEKLDSYCHRLSVKEEIAYEEAREIMMNSIERLKNKHYHSDNLVKSAYKYSRNKIEKENHVNDTMIGGSNKNVSFGTRTIAASKNRVKCLKCRKYHSSEGLCNDYDILTDGQLGGNYGTDHKKKTSHQTGGNCGKDHKKKSIFKIVYM